MTEQSDKTQAWARLKVLAEQFDGVTIAELFEADPARFEALQRRCGPLLLDMSKQRVTNEVLAELCRLADASGLSFWRERLFAGERVNTSEGRSAMHWALRLPAEADGDLDGLPLAGMIHAQLQRMESLVTKLHAGQWRGVSGEAITHVVNIGVGGSDLGPLMVCDALRDFKVETAGPLRVYFASTMDGSQLAQILQTLNPHTTLFIVSSKSFTTIDTLSNADTARQWLQRSLGDSPALLQCHFIGVSAAPEKMTEWGISKSNQLLLWDWVGGRYSLWSAIGLPIALTLGMAGFRELLDGAHHMDWHFCEAPGTENLPVLMAMLGIWNVNLLGINALAILPYDGRLKQFPAYLEQLEMESNGKRVTRDGALVTRNTCPIIWGDVGPNAQHAFYQLLHQGTQPVACDFIVPARRYREAQHLEGMEELAAQHQLAIANCLAQSRLLAFGDAALADAESLPLYRRYRGNQPCTTLLLDELSPFSLGALIALYEHKVFVQSVIWEINPFDQWGVEMGKLIAVDALAQLRAEQPLGQGLDASTAGLLAAVMDKH
ncbi:MAG: glucose-6-phosphate isomerase [Gammaproteobacteria bacterium HGW-Gammaproteobacteria-11]|nr:MAG: glucose-6-phosphate isomerase [Gammaproteobacteria bacterium HGW-Gammaproteobacteria-11]